jgi:hypothetical protein
MDLDRLKITFKILNLNIDNFKNLKFKDFYYNYKKYMRLVDYENIFDYLK